MHHIASYEQARKIVDRLMRAVRPGSYLVISHSTNVINGARSDEAVAQWNKFGKPQVILRSPDQIAGFFDGLELLEPAWYPPHGGGPDAWISAANHGKSTSSAASPASPDLPPPRRSP